MVSLDGKNFTLEVGSKRTETEMERRNHTETDSKVKDF